MIKVVWIFKKASTLLFRFQTPKGPEILFFMERAQGYSGRQSEACRKAIPWRFRPNYWNRSQIEQYQDAESWKRNDIRHRTAYNPLMGLNLIASSADGRTLFPLCYNIYRNLWYWHYTYFPRFSRTDYGGNALFYGILASKYPAFQLIWAPFLEKLSDFYGRKRFYSKSGWSSPGMD